MATWPASLPQFVLTEGFEESPPDVLLRTEMDAGPAKVRRRFTAGVRPLKAVIVCSSAQVTTLETFFAAALASGALPFDWVHPRTQAATSFRFVRPPSIAPERGGKYWRVGLDLEVLP
jgi:hypothetical protein